MAKKINVNEFRAFIGNNGDMAGPIYSLIKQCKNDEETILFFPKDIYHIYYSKCYEEYVFIANHDHGLKKIAFPLKGLKNVTVDGNGSEFIFHGRVLPFLIEDCSNVTICNLSIDYERPFYTEGEVLSADHTQVTLRINPEQYPFYVENETIHFYSKDDWDNTYIKWFIEFDPKRRAPAYGLGGSDLRAQKVKAERLGKDVVRFKAKFREKHTVGNIINMTNEQRYNPGICIKESEDIYLKNINIYHAGAMGIIAQNSKHISLDNVKISTREGNSRFVSTNNDATHFVNCEGLIKMENCTFQHQLDDGTNIHGMYYTISSIYKKDLIEVEIMHFQQNGVCVVREGDRIAIVDNNTRLHKGYATITSVEQINQKFIRLGVELEGEVDICIGDCVENYMRMPEVQIRNCKIGNNRARGLLISTNKKAIIENNYFYTSGSSIRCGGEMEKWYESGAVKDLIIRNNRFINCGYAKWGKGIIDIAPKLKEPLKQECLHSNIKIINNEFYTFRLGLLNMLSVKGIEFSNNTIKRSYDFEPFGDLNHCLEFKACENVVIKNNSFYGFQENELINIDERTNKNLKISDQNML